MNYLSLTPMQVQTQNGFIDFDNPKQEQINIRDIAHALSNIPRFNGHLEFNYSVAQHSIYVAKLVLDSGFPAFQLQALLHDASEAYLCDIPRPIKHKEPLQSIYVGMERKLMNAIGFKFGFNHIKSALVNDADMFAACVEAIAYMRTVPEWAVKMAEDFKILHGWDYKTNCSIDSLFYMSIPYDSKTAKTVFLTYFNALCPGYML